MRRLNSPSAPLAARDTRATAVALARLSFADLHRCLAGLHDRRWFRHYGALVQKLTPPAGRELGLVVAGGALVRGRPEGGWVVLELKAAVDLRDDYSPADRDAFAVAVAARHPVAEPPLTAAERATGGGR